MKTDEQGRFCARQETLQLINQHLEKSEKYSKIVSGITSCKTLINHEMKTFYEVLRK